MPGSEDLLRIIDAPYEVSQLQMVISKATEMMELVKNFKGISLASKTTDSTADFKAQETAITGALTKIAALEKEIDTMRAGHSTNQKIRTEEEIRQTENLRAVNKSKVDNIRAEGNAYKQLALEYNRAAIELKALIVQYGQSDSRVISMTEHVGQMYTRLREADAVVGQHTRNVGNYGSAWEKVGFSFKGLGPFFASVKESFKGIGEAAAGMIGGIILVQKTFEFIKDSVKAFMDAEASTSRLTNILSNLGREDALAELNREAKELSETLGTVAQKDVTETFQKLVTYGKLTKNQILELTPVIADFAAKQRIDMPEATSAITKALEGNARALKEYGINMKDGKDSTERFAIIMEQLKPRVDGAAKAFGETLAGGMKKSEIAMEELKVQVGSEFAPAINRAETAILQGAKGIPQMFEAINNGFQNIMEKGKLAFLALVKVATFGRSTAFDDYVKDKDARNKILEDSKQLQAAKEEAESFRKQASERTLSAQAHELDVQKQLLIGDLARYKQEAAKGAVTKETTYELQKQNEIVKALVGQYNSSRDTSILGFGGGTEHKKKAKKEKEDKIKRDTLGIEYSLTEARERGENQLDSFEKGHGAFVDNIGGQIDATADANAAKAKKEADAAQALSEHKARMRDFEMEGVLKTENLIKSVKDGQFEREINQIQKLIDKNNELRAKESRAIANSTLSIQEKAAAQILLDARVESNNEALRRKQRDIKIKEAQFDKANAILQIEQQGAIAAIAALKIPIYGEAEAIAIEALTQAEAIAIAAKPVPQYEVGTENHPGGPMITHKGELRIDPDGKASITPNVPTLTFGQKGTKIIPADEVNRMMLGDMMKQTAFKISDNKKELNEIRDAITEGTMAQLRAMRKKKPDNIHIHFNPGFNEHINREVRN